MEEFEEFLKEIHEEDSKNKEEAVTIQLAKYEPVINHIYKHESISSSALLPLIFFTDKMIIDSYKVLLAQLFGMPIQLPRYITINGIGRYLVSFESIEKLIKEGQIERCDIDPSLQVWAGPKETVNAIVTFYAKDNRIYIVKVFYDTTLNRAFPPMNEVEIEYSQK